MRLGFFAAMASNLLLMVVSFEFIEITLLNLVQQSLLVKVEQKLLASVYEDSPHKHF